MEDKAKILLEKARTRLVSEDCPYWGTLCMGMSLVEDTDKDITQGTMATNGKEIYWDREFVESLSIPELEFVLAHEAGVHKGLLHHVRLRQMGEGVDLKVFNEAADYAGNGILIGAGIGKAPKGVLYDPKYNGKSMEQIYPLLMKEKQQQQEGQEQEKEQGGNDPGNCGGVLPTPEEQDIDVKEAEEEAKSEVRQALQAAKKAGHVPDGLRKMIEDLLEPKVDWRSLLAQYVIEKAKNDFSWNRPNRRYLPQNIYMPQVDNTEFGGAVLLIDVSGSISEEQARAAITEGLNILSELPGSVLQVIFFADRASEPIEIDDPKQVKSIRELKVGWGTDYKPPFQKVQDVGLEPKVIIVLTDGECNSFPTYVEAPVIWLINNKDPFHPPFGEVVRMLD